MPAAFEVYNIVNTLSSVDIIKCLGGFGKVSDFKFTREDKTEAYVKFLVLDEIIEDFVARV